MSHTKRLSDIAAPSVAAVGPASAHALYPVLDEINAITGAKWQVGTFLAGGFQSGAWQIHDGALLAVLKLGAPGWASRVLGAAALVASARAAGYPTPSWHAAGVLRDGRSYSIQEFVTGDAPTSLDPPTAEIILDLTHAQRRIRLPTSIDWSQYSRDVVFQHLRQESPLGQLGGSSAAVANAVRTLGERYESALLPNDEMVHGDLNISNMVCANGQLAGVIDIEAIGRGCAVFDLLKPALQASVWGDKSSCAEVLETAALERYDIGPVMITSGALVMDLLTFGATHWDPPDMEPVAHACLGWFYRLERQALGRGRATGG